MPGTRPRPISWYRNRGRRSRQAKVDQAARLNRLCALDHMYWAIEDVQKEMRAEYRKGNIPPEGLRKADINDWPSNVARGDISRCLEHCEPRCDGQ